MDARLFVEAAAGVSRAEIIADPQRALSPAQARTLEGYLARRERREPVSHILGVKGFWKITLAVTPDVLTPRPDTETLLDVLLPIFPAGRRFTMVDLGVGSGAILLAMLAERPLAVGLGVDFSKEALAVARGNADRLGLASRALFLRADWAAGLAGGSFDLAVSNPPYIPTGELVGLEPEVRDHEPRLALDGGPDGLTPLRALAPQLLRVLRPGGVFAVEIGAAQRAVAEALFREAGAADVWTTRDLGGRDRVLAGSKKALGECRGKD